ncbi:MAG: cupin domain-containing protein [Haloarculaceae archaeon]
MAYDAAATEDIPLIDLYETELPAEHDIRDIDDALDLDQMRVKIWYFEPGEEIQPHAHAKQEELYYVLEGEFELTLGDPDESETKTISEGSFYVAGPETGHGHRYVGDDRGAILAIGAPQADDPGRDPREFQTE